METHVAAGWFEGEFLTARHVGNQVQMLFGQFRRQIGGGGGGRGEVVAMAFADVVVNQAKRRLVNFRRARDF